jgi:DNA repair protein RadA
MPKKMDDDPCSVIEKISSSQAARRLAEYCREKNLDPRVIATLSPQDLKDFIEIEPEQSVSLLRKLQDALGVEVIIGGPVKHVMERKKSMKVMKTRVAEFDEKTPWGGVRFGAIYGFAGEYGTGKSLMAMQIALYAAAEGNRVVYIYTEGQFNEVTFKRIKARVAQELNVSEDQIDENMEIYEVVNSLALQQLIVRIPSTVNVLVVDSIIEPFRAEYKGREQLSVRQQDLHYTVNLIKRRCTAFNMLAIVTNQVMDVPEIFMTGVKKMAGGNVVAHNIDYIFFMYKPNKKKEEGIMYPHDVPGMSPTTEIHYIIKDDGLY